MKSFFERWPKPPLDNRSAAPDPSSQSPARSAAMSRKIRVACVAVVFKEHGAVKVVECWGSDVPDGATTSFPMAVKRKEDETVVFSWITWPSRKVHDEGMKKAMADPRLQPDRNPMPFDGKRLIYGGFEVILDA